MDSRTQEPVTLPPVFGDVGPSEPQADMPMNVAPAAATIVDRRNLVRALRAASIVVMEVFPVVSGLMEDSSLGPPHDTGPHTDAGAGVGADRADVAVCLVVIERAEAELHATIKRQFRRKDVLETAAEAEHRA